MDPLDSWPAGLPRIECSVQQPVSPWSPSSPSIHSVRSPRLGSGECQGVKITGGKEHGFDRGEKYVTIKVWRSRWLVHNWKADPTARRPAPGVAGLGTASSSVMPNRDRIVLFHLTNGSQADDVARTCSRPWGHTRNSVGLVQNGRRSYNWSRPDRLTGLAGAHARGRAGNAAS